MKRYAAFFLSILLLAAMTACAAPSGASRPDTGTEPPSAATPAPARPDGQAPDRPLPGEQPSPPQDTQAPEPAQPYEALVERFYTLAADPYSFENSARYGELGVIESAGAMEDHALDALGYIIEDISGDGVPELVVGTLPEYGGQVHAVYTLVDGEPQFVFEGWYRNSYAYIGDGRFFYCGSSGAAETGQGVVSLTRDGTDLNCEEFYFTHGAAGEDYSDLRVYFNTTGSWDVAESQEADLSLEDFWAWEPEYQDLPLTPFSSYGAERGYDNTAGAAVGVQWAELQLPELADYEEFVADDGAYSVDVLFTARRTVTDFELMRLTIQEVYDDGTVSYASDPVYSMERLTPECPLMVRMTFPGDTPSWGISYVDASGNGMVHRLTVEISGEDGTLLLHETY